MFSFWLFVCFWYLLKIWFANIRIGLCGNQSRTWLLLVLFIRFQFIVRAEAMHLAWIIDSRPELFCFFHISPVALFIFYFIQFESLARFYIEFNPSIKSHGNIHNLSFTVWLFLGQLLFAVQQLLCSPLDYNLYQLAKFHLSEIVDTLFFDRFIFFFCFVQAHNNFRLLFLNQINGLLHWWNYVVKSMRVNGIDY